jgi:hypothetical protein
MMHTATPDTTDVVTRFARSVAAIGAVEKSSEADAGTYTYKYATLPATLAEVRRVCDMHGLVMSQNMTGVSNEHGDYLEVTTSVIALESGQVLTFDPARSKVPADPQKQGGASTYLRRYSLVSLWSIPTPDDDDGHAARQGIHDDATKARERHNAAVDVNKRARALSDAGREVVRAIAERHGRPVTVDGLTDDDFRADVLAQVEMFEAKAVTS